MTIPRSNKHRLMVLAIAGMVVLASLGRGAGLAQAATPWGELGIAHLTAGTEPGQVEVVRGSPSAFAADPTDGSYYIADEVKSSPESEFRIQRFNAKGEAEASISFVPAEVKRSATGSTGKEIQLAVDPARDRVYALIVYERRGLDEKEEKEYEKECATSPTTCYERAPLDADELAAGDLYAFNYTGGKLVSAKTSEGAPAPILNETGLRDQGEKPKEALLNPRGMAIEPASGDIAITGDEDGQLDEKVEKTEGTQECRVSVQDVTVQETKTPGELGGKLGDRYVDNHEALEELDCAKGLEEAVQDEYVPASPVMSTGGKLFAEEPVCPPATSCNGPEVWELPASSEQIGETNGVKEFATLPRLLYELPEQEALVTLAEPLVGDTGPTLSFVPGESSSEGKLYVAAEVAQESKGHSEPPTSAVLVLGYSEAGATPEAHEIGWIGGAPEEGGAHEGCVIPKASLGPFFVGGFSGGGKEGVVAFDAYEREEEPVIDALQFGLGGSTKGCPHATVGAPSVKVNGVAVKTLLPHEAATFSSIMEAANAVSVEWEFENTTTKKVESVPSTSNEYSTTSLVHEFSEEGEYKITEVVQTDNLAALSAEVTSEHAFTVELALPKFEIEGPASVEKGQALTLSANVEDQNKSAEPFEYVWKFGGKEGEERGKTEGATTLISVKHTYQEPCEPCIITLEVTDKDGAKATNITPFEVTVHKDQQEIREEREHKEHKEREEREHKEREEREKKEREEREQKEHEGAKAGETGLKTGGGGSTVAPEATIAGSSLAVGPSGSVSLKVSCPSGASGCSGTVTLRTASAVSASKHKKKAILTLASGSFSVSGGAVTTVILHLTAKARALLAHSHVLRALASIVAHNTAGESRTTQTALTLRLSKASTHGHKH